MKEIIKVKRFEVHCPVHVFTIVLMIFVLNLCLFAQGQENGQQIWDESLPRSSEIHDHAALISNQIENREWRPLTMGEIFMLWPFFRDSLSYKQIRIYRKKYAIFQRIQPMAPDGNIYYNPKDPNYADDFSEHLGFESCAEFIHEIVHVWQKQHGMNVILRRLLEGARYGDEWFGVKLLPGQDLLDYPIESQADLIKQYFICISRQQWETPPITVPLHQALVIEKESQRHCGDEVGGALDRFIENPNYVSLTHKN